MGTKLYCPCGVESLVPALGASSLGIVVAVVVVAFALLLGGVGWLLLRPAPEQGVETATVSRPAAEPPSPPPSERTLVPPVPPAPPVTAKSISWVGAKLVGTWQAQSSPSWANAAIEFTRDGQANLRGEIEGVPLNLWGTYQLQGDKLEIVLTHDARTVKESVTITGLTDDRLEHLDRAGQKHIFVKARAAAVPGEK